MSLQVFADLKERLRSIPIEDFIKDVVEENKDSVELLNVFQLKDGQDSEGVQINTYRDYTQFTKMIKQQKGQPTDKVTLEDTGAFHASIKAKVSGKQITLDATDPKRNKLVKKYGKEIFGLDDESKEAFSQEVLKDKLIEKTRNHLLK